MLYCFPFLRRCFISYYEPSSYFAFHVQVVHSDQVLIFWPTKLVSYPREKIKIRKEKRGYKRPKLNRDGRQCTWKKVCINDTKSKSCGMVCGGRDNSLAPPSSLRFNTSSLLKPLSLHSSRYMHLSLYLSFTLFFFSPSHYLFWENVYKPTCIHI